MPGHLAVLMLLTLTIFGSVCRGGFPLRAAAYAEDITPSQLPISLAGSMADTQASAIHDRIHARAVLLESGKQRLGIVVCDSCMIPREIFDQAKARLHKSLDLDPGCMLMAATHSHSCPTVTGVFQSDPNEVYRKQLCDGIVSAVTKAADRLAPAAVAWGSAQCPDQVFHRRWHMKPGSVPVDPFGRNSDRVQMNPPVGSPNLIEPAGPIDPELSVVSIVSWNGDPIALIANYSLHYVGGVPAKSISADYFGEFARVVGQRLAPNRDSFVAMMTNGTSGNINNIDFRGGQESRRPFEQIRTVASRVADVAISACEQHKPIEDVTLATARREIELLVRKPTAEEVMQAKAVLATAGDRPLVGTREVYARETVKLAEYPDTVKLWIQAIRIGPIGIVAIPCEVFVEIGLEIKDRSPLRPTFMIELANGYNGYLPTPQQHALGGYETWRARSSYLEVDASSKITECALELLADVAKD